MDRGHSRLYPFDPDSGHLPEIAAPGALVSGAGGGVVTLIVTPDVARSSWSPAAAIAVARAWSDQGHRVILFDLSLTEPVLHQTLGLPNAVGVVDLVLSEASMPSVAQQAGAPGFQFVSVGTPVEDPTEITLSDAWSAFVEEVGSAQARVLFYVPADLPGVDALIARSTATLLLAGDPTEAEWVAESFALDEVWGLLEDRGPPPPTEGSIEMAGEVEAEASTEVVEAGSARVPETGVEPTTEAEPQTETEPGTDSVPTTEAEPETDTEAVALETEAKLETGTEPDRRRIPWRPALVGTLVGLGALFLLQRMLVPADQTVPVALTEDFQTSVSAEPSPPEPQQAYSLALAAYQTREAAGRHAQRLAQRRPDLLFIVAPVRVADRVYHRVLAGPSVDSLGAERLRESLAETLTGDDGARWIVRPTPLAFDFGGFESIEAATGRVAEIGNAGIGAYVFEVAGSTAPGFRVYAGAYQSPAEADVMRTELDTAFGGVPILGPRIGRYVR